MEHELVLLINK